MLDMEYKKKKYSCRFTHLQHPSSSSCKSLITLYSQQYFSFSFSAARQSISSLSWIQRLSYFFLLKSNHSPRIRYKTTTIHCRAAASWRGDAILLYHLDSASGSLYSEPMEMHANAVPRQVVPVETNQNGVASPTGYRRGFQSNHDPFFF